VSHVLITICVRESASAICEIIEPMTLHSTLQYSTEQHIKY
jgi:hypothetical protein